MACRKTISMLVETPNKNPRTQKNDIEIREDIARGKFGCVAIAELKDKSYDIPKQKLRPSMAPFKPIEPPSRMATQVLTRPSVKPLNTVFKVPLSKTTSTLMERGYILRRSGVYARASISRNPSKVALKQQVVRKPNDKNDSAYTECRVFKALSELMNLRYTNNFIYMYDWFKSYFDEDETTQMFNIEMELGETTLAEWKKKTKNEPVSYDVVKEICFQVTWALLVAQKEIQFMHTDLHAKNLMINTSKTKHNYLNTKDNTIWKMSNVVVKICDFGLSSVVVNDVKIGRSSNVFDEMVDRNKFVEDLTGISFIKYENGEDKKNFTMFKKWMKNSEKRYRNLGEVLYCPFFDSLRTKALGQDSTYSYKFE